MGETIADPHLTERLVDVLDPRKEILEAYLFGSHARGQAQPHSDVDVGVVARVLTENLDDFDEIARCVERHLNESPAA